MATDTACRGLQKEKAEEMLKRYLSKGQTVYCVLRSAAKSGMSRRIDFYAITTGVNAPELRFLSGYISTLLDIAFPGPAKEGLLVRGTGMDMGFHVVYELAHALFGNGYDLKSEWI